MKPGEMVSGVGSEQHRISRVGVLDQGHHQIERVPAAEPPPFGKLIDQGQQIFAPVARLVLQGNGTMIESCGALTDYGDR